MFDFLSKKAPPTISREQSLKGIPVLNEGVTREVNAEGEPVLVIPRVPYFMPGLLKHLGMTKMGPKQLILDPLGASVLDGIDGKRNVKKLIQTFVEANKIHPKEAEKMVVNYLNELLKRHAVSVVFK